MERKNEVIIKLSDGELHKLQEIARTRRWNIEDVIRYELFFVKKNQRNDIQDVREFLQEIVEEISDRVKDEFGSRLQEVIDEIVMIRYLLALNFLYLKMSEYNIDTTRLIRTLEYMFVSNQDKHGLIDCYNILNYLEEFKKEGLLKKIYKQAEKIEDDERELISMFIEDTGQAGQGQVKQTGQTGSFSLSDL